MDWTAMIAGAVIAAAAYRAPRIVAGLVRSPIAPGPERADGAVAPAE